jgi:hypothetical protein
MNKGGNITTKKHAIRHVATVAVTVATWPFSKGEMSVGIISHSNVVYMATSLNVVMATSLNVVVTWPIDHVGFVHMITWDSGTWPRGHMATWFSARGHIQPRFIVHMAD